jgi:hypothetical protein
MIKHIPFALLCAVPALPQILQEHPELCGTAVPVPVPPNVWAEIQPSNGVAVLHLGKDRAIELKGVNDEIHELCPAGPRALVSFGFNYVGYSVNIVDQSGRTPSDSFLAYDPLMSPNQRWIAFRHFSPPMGEIQTSEEYLLYDLHASPEANRRAPPPGLGVDAVGWAMYPAFPGFTPINLDDIPEADLHSWRSRSFFWTRDSQSLLFADSVGGTLSLVLVLIRSDKPQAYTRVVSPEDVCGASAAADPGLTLVSASIGFGEAPRVLASFKSADASCQPRDLDLASSDFAPAQVEIYAPRPRKTPVGIDAKQPQ